MWEDIKMRKHALDKWLLFFLWKDILNFNLTKSIHTPKFLQFSFIIYIWPDYFLISEEN